MKILVVSADRTIEGGAPANLGDALLTDALLDALSERGHFARAADFGLSSPANRPRVRLNGARDLFRTLRDYDAVVIGGGTLLQDDQPTRLAAGLPRLCLVVSLFARARGRKVFFFGVGCDSISRVIPRLMLRVALSSAEIWVREEESAKRVRAMFGASPHLAADVALLSADVPARDPAAQGVIFALNRRDSGGLTKEIADAFSQDVPARFLSMEQRRGEADDEPLRDEVRDRMSTSPHNLQWIDAWRQIAGCQTVVASRMHALYMAIMAGTPAVAVGTSEKVRAFADEFGIPRIDSLDQLRPGNAGLANPAALRVAAERVRAATDQLDASLKRWSATRRKLSRKWPIEGHS